MIRTTRQQAHSNQGSVLLEIVGTMFLLVTLTFISTNIGILLFAAWKNDSTCATAARAAAQRTTAEDAKQAAMLIVGGAGIDGGKLFGSPELRTKPGDFKFEVYPDSDGVPQPEMGPYVQVTTQLRCKLLVPMFLKNGAFTDTVTFSQAYSYPILNPAVVGENTIDDGLFDEVGDDSDEEEPKDSTPDEPVDQEIDA